MLNVFGYEHPESRIIAFLKYVPSEFKTIFDVHFLERKWKLGRSELFRAEKLYTAQNYQTFLYSLRRNFPAYLYACPFRGKEIIAPLVSAVKEVYVPRECLRTLKDLEDKDILQRETLDFVTLLSSESGIRIEEFGVHGSVALGMHSSRSDIDVVVYGSRNFRVLEKTVHRLVKAGRLSYQFNNRLDAARCFKGRYGHRIFMYNAIRSPEEVTTRYGESKFTPVMSVEFRCTVEDDGEAMFRPAIYGIEDFEPTGQKGIQMPDRVPEFVVSMIGCYRNVARKGDKMKVAGMLERVQNLRNGKVHHQVVVGSGTSEKEHIWPL